MAKDQEYCHRVWVERSALHWELAEVVASPSSGPHHVVKDESLMLVRLKSGEVLGIPETKTRPVNATEASDVDDLTTLQFLDEPNILHTLRFRFERDAIYTYTGTILISINPWKNLPGLYNEKTMQAYKSKSSTDLQKLPPHAFAVALTAFECLRRTAADQAILVSGESGAGKTESTKHLMQLLASVAGGGEQTGIQQQVLGSNPILEAFGNAKTLRNDNSSRFGKFIEMHFSAPDHCENPHLVGAAIHTYLLEKSRIVSIASGERNYHIFYQICASESPEMSGTFFCFNLASSSHYIYRPRTTLCVAPFHDYRSSVLILLYMCQDCKWAT
jgi:myosin-5